MSRQRLELRLRIEDVEAIAAQERDLLSPGDVVPESLELVGDVRVAPTTEHIDHLAEHPRLHPRATLDAVEHVGDGALELPAVEPVRADDPRQRLLRIRHDEEACALGVPKPPAARVEPLGEQAHVLGRGDEHARLVALEPRHEVRGDGVREVNGVLIDLHTVGVRCRRP